MKIILTVTIPDDVAEKEGITIEQLKSQGAEIKDALVSESWDGCNVELTVES